MKLAVKICLALLTVSLVFQLLAMISTPITSIPLSASANFKYGVFGYCNIHLHKCTSRKIGYSPQLEPAPTPSNKNPLLPSGLKYNVTRLLAVHPLSFSITLTLYILVFLLGHQEVANSPMYLLSVALFSLPTFLLCLLSFLVDVLIFSAHLCWTGWLILPATIIIAICCSLLWNLRRTVSIKNYEVLQSSRANTIETYSMQDWRDRPKTPPTGLNSEYGKPLLEPEFTYTTTID
ncbi:regulator of ime2 [Zygosaccharomyces mellis]|uniref:Regulator of ime2 n=1 Tax=Zygosaccharomyces mellis TaxID=42258 RepID=A0A4C2ECE5_9SACH|nr:regulator of ime2 [Zygosaccharomyces mellis]